MADVVGIGTLVLMVVFIIVATPVVLYRALRHIRIRRGGQIAKARVLEVTSEILNLDYLDVRTYRVEYQYVDHHDVWHNGISHLLMSDPRPALGDGPGRIRFDREAPEHSVWLGPADPVKHG